MCTCCAIKQLLCGGNEQYFIARCEKNPLELSGVVFKIVTQDENIVVANKINNCFTEGDKTRPYTFDRKRWKIIPVSFDVAMASKF